MFILALDGGGIRGAYSARLLQRLELGFPTLIAGADLVAGTSTGGIIALGLAAGIEPAEIVTFYMDRARSIFDPARALLSLAEISEPKYSNAGLKAGLEAILGDKKLSDLGHDVLVTTYDCFQRKPREMTRQSEPGLLCVEAGLRTSAAPVYFPPFQGFIDGGMAANDPALCATAWALAHGHRLDEIRCLSIGTGNANRPRLMPGNWGALQWITEGGFIDLVFEGPAERADIDCQRLLGTRYFRLDGSVDCALDETNNLQERLIAPADRFDLTPVVAWLHATLKPPQA
jgi:uncharacterized protein